MTRKNKFKSYYENGGGLKKYHLNILQKLNLSSLKSWLEKPNKIKKNNLTY